jgi:hypothetical protein
MSCKKHILPIIVLAQFSCSLWFASNAVMSDLVKNLIKENH